MTPRTFLFAIAFVWLIGFGLIIIAEQKHELDMARQGLCRYDHVFVKCKDKVEE